MSPDVSPVGLVGCVLVLTGVGLMAVAAIGVLRLPDVYLRMNAATKAGSLGVALVLAGCAALMPTPHTVAAAVIAIVLQFATSPVAALVIGRAAYRSGAPLWPGTTTDELGRRVPDRSGPRSRATRPDVGGPDR